MIVGEFLREGCEDFGRCNDWVLENFFLGEDEVERCVVNFEVVLDGEVLFVGVVGFEVLWDVGVVGWDSGCGVVDCELGWLMLEVDFFFGVGLEWILFLEILFIEDVMFVFDLFVLDLLRFVKFFCVVLFWFEFDLVEFGWFLVELFVVFCM